MPQDAQRDNINNGYPYLSWQDGEDVSLPVTLSAFSARGREGAVLIDWTTQTEVNNVGFAIYRSDQEDGNYTKIAFITGVGNSAMPSDYQFKDTKAEPGKTYFYYIEDIDITGERNKSDIIK